MAQLYYRGQGVEKNNSKAAELYHLAGEKGYTPSYVILALFYENGIGVEKNLKEALRWAEKAKDVDPEEADSIIKRIHHNMITEEEKHNQAVKKVKKLFLSAQTAYQNEDYETTVKCLEPLVSAGVTVAMCFMGQLYHLGRGVERDDAKSFELYSKAAEKGDANAYLPLAVSYANGWGVPKNLDVALQWAEKAKAANVKDADSIIKKIHHNMIIEDNKEILAKSYEEFPDDKYGTSELLKLLSEQYDSIDAEKRFGLTLRLSLRGVGGPTIQSICGRSYYFGNGVKQDDAKALYWLEQTAEFGFRDSQLRCGYLYLRNRGVKKDLCKSLYWFEKAAEKGEREAMFNCGVMYSNGEGTSVDKEKGFSYTRASAEKGYPKAMYNLAWMYANGEGTQVNLAEAIMYMEKFVANTEDQELREEAKKSLEAFRSIKPTAHKL